MKARYAPSREHSVTADTSVVISRLLPEKIWKSVPNNKNLKKEVVFICCIFALEYIADKVTTNSVIPPTMCSNNVVLETMFLL